MENFGIISTFIVGIAVVSAQDKGSTNETEYEYAPYDGWYNNLANPSWGAADTVLFRRLPPVYSDGAYEPSGTTRPNPIDISMALFNGSTGRGSFLNRTAFQVFFGQQVVEEIVDAQRPGCPREFINIKVPTGHPQYDPEGKGEVEIPLLRSRYNQRTGLSPNNPRQQLNEITPFIDGTLMYGPNKVWTDGIRTFRGGRLQTTQDPEATVDKYKNRDYPRVNDFRLPFANPPPPREHYLKPIKRFFMIGNPRGNENPALLTMGIIWHRYHNHIAQQIEAAHPEYKDEKIFNEARKWVIAVHQKVVMYDWLPAWLDQDVPEYSHYDASVNPSISHIFSTAAMRFGHTLVTPGFYIRNGECDFRKPVNLKTGARHEAVRTCNSYFNPQDTIDEFDGIDEIIMGLSSQIAEAEDMIITPDLRGDVFGPLEFSRRDLMAINIQRGRDHGLPDYNTARKRFQLARIERFQDINPQLNRSDPGLVARLEEVYGGDIDNLDIFVGGMMETWETGPGPLFTAVTLDQFVRIRDGDRFWFENWQDHGLFTEDEVSQIWNITMYDIILKVTDIKPGDIQEDPFFWHSDDPCPQPRQLKVDVMEKCSPVQTYDYFKGSEVSYAATFAFVLATLPVAIGLLFGLAKAHDKMVAKKMTVQRKKTQKKEKGHVIHALEWMGKKEGERSVKLQIDLKKRQLSIKDDKGRLVRVLDLILLKSKGMKTMDIIVSADKDMTMMVIKVAQEYDVIIKFDAYKDRNEFLELFKELVTKCNLTMNPINSNTEKDIKAMSVSKKTRDVLLEKFFRVIFGHAFKYEKGDNATIHVSEAKLVFGCELTRYEFSEVLGLKPDSIFVNNMFSMADKDQDGYLTFREFLDMIIIFSKGDATSKVKLMFDMYDLDQDGKLSIEEFKNMLKSLLEIANESLPEDDIDRLVDEMFKDRKLGLAAKKLITFDDFRMLMSDYESQLSYTSLNLEGSTLPQGVKKVRNRPSTRAEKVMDIYGTHDDVQHSASTKRRMSSISDEKIETLQTTAPMNPVTKAMLPLQRFFENNSWQIFWLSLYTWTCIGIFAERMYYYSIEREHGGLRTHASYGVSVTRGAASGMMFTYVSLLVTMCRNTINFLRDTVLHKFIPFDSAVTFHKIIAMYAAFFTLLHIVGHMFNFYHIVTQTADDLNCIFRDFFHATDELPDFNYWAWGTITGFTGILLTILCFFMYVFATQYARRHAFRAFWITHNMHYALWILMILHGAGRLVQPGFFHFFFLGPIILFTLDKLVSVSRKKVQLSVVNSEILPSAVTKLVFRRPENFEYKSGQWIRIACLELGSGEYHPFTLSSAPYEENLSLHIRAVGPWTMNIRNLFSEEGANEKSKLFIDGPYGEGHQDWYRYEVAVLVGGGIGVTPFASILKDLAYKSKHNERIRCRKVYFIWVTRTQKQFEWMTDIIKQVEERDARGLVSVHIFVTQFKEKFDIRTTMLYICERYFQKVSNKSLLTGLQSITHFGRPDFSAFFSMLQRAHQHTNVFGVFSCGPPPMTASVEKACTEMNNMITNSHFVHHSDNF